MNKVIAFNDLQAWRASLKGFHGPLVATNGCFDLLHVGHIRYLQQARELGGALLVGINDDAGVRELKGPTRPLNAAEDRAEVLAALSCVDAVCIFPGKRAVEFLRLSAPDLYVKGGDYTEETLDRNEVDAIRNCGGTIKILPLTPGKSTTNIVARAGKTTP